jgi:hypothetical protein
VIDIDTTFRAMVVCALWTSTDESGEPLDERFDAMDVDASTLRVLREELEDFIASNTALLGASGLDSGQIGHDFWLTRNRHGAGFWDRGRGEVGEALTTACRPYGEVTLYVGDDGRVYA